jgi:DNA-binding MarR family transcriptional regulator
MDDKQEKAMAQLLQIHKLFHREQTQNFTGLGGQGRVLKMLQTQPEISQKELTRMLGMSKQAAAKLAEKLEKGGYIERAPSQTDGRTYSITLTEKGAAAALKMEGDRRELGLDCLSDSELDTLTGLHGRIIKHFAEVLNAAKIETGQSEGGGTE